MCRQFPHAVLVILFLALIIIGCSGNPVSPDETSDVPLALSSATQSETSANSRNLLGYYKLTVAPQTGDVQIVPVRNADFHLNVTGTLNLTMGVTAVGVPGESDPANGLIVMDVTLDHPFGTKPQFSGFDVKGILITPGSLDVGSLVFADADETQLENADGFSRWWNPTEFTAPGMFGYTQGALTGTPQSSLTATVNPYKYFADILYPTSSLAAVVNEPLDSDLGRGVFRSGESNTRRYNIRFEMDPGPQIVFGYAVDCSWALPDPKPPSEIPDDFPIEANQPEAYRIGIQEEFNSLYYDSESGTGGGVLRLQVSVFDWQGQEAGAIADEIDAVRILSPDLFGGGITVAFDEETTTKAMYSADLTTDIIPTHAGDTVLVVMAKSQDGPGYDQGFGPAPAATISAFQTMLVDVIDPECTADANDDFVDYIEFDLSNPITGQLCSPTDFKDYYRFEFDPGFALSGNLVLYCDAEPSRMELYNFDEVLIGEESVGGGTASIDLGSLDLMPGQYYIRVVTQSSGQAFLYMLEFDGELTDLTPDPQSVTPEMLYFETLWAASDDNYAYFSGNFAFWIFDLAMDLDSVPYSRTEVISYGRPGVHYPYACFMDMDFWGDDTMDLLDMTDPANPVLYEEVFTEPESIHAVTLDSNYIYVAIHDGADEKLVVLDYLADPANPVVISDSLVFNDTIISLDIMDPDGPEKYLIARHAYEPEIRIYDVSDPSSPSMHVYFWWTNGEIRDISSDGYFIYIILSHLDMEHLYIFEVLPAPGYGLFRGNTALTQDAHYVDARGDYAYITDNDNSITVVNVSDPDIPVEGWMGSIPYGASYIDVQGTSVFIVHPYAGLGIYHAALDSEWVGVTGSILGVNQTRNGVVDGDYLYATQSFGDYNKSVITLDISDPENTSLAGYLEFDDPPNQIKIANGRMVVGTVQDTFWTVNMFNPTNLSLEIETPTPASISGMEMTGSHIYIADHSSQFLIYSFTAWPNVNLESTVSVPSPMYYLIIRDTVLYGVSGDKVYVFSIVDPELPVLENSYVAPGDVFDITIQDNYLYALTLHTVEILDITDPLNPVFVSSAPLSTGSWTVDIAVDGQFAWVGTNSDNSYLLRVWPPEDPVEIGKFYETDWTSSTWETFIIGDYYIDFRYPYGIEIMDMYP